MSTKSPSPDSSPSAVSPSLISTPPPQTNATPPRTPPPSVLAPPPDVPVVPAPAIVSSPPPDSSPPPPPIAPTISTPPPTSSTSPPPPLVKPPENSPPPPEALSTPPPEVSTPPVDSPPPPPLSLLSPTISPPPPENSPPPSPESKPPQISPPPPPQSKPPQNSPPAPPQSKPPQISPPPPPLESNPPENSPPPPPLESNPPENSPPAPSSKPPENSSPPPPLTSKPPQNSPSPPSPKPPQNSSPPPPQKSRPPQNSPPQPPSSKPPNSSPPPPASKPPGKSPPPPRRTPPPISQPSPVPSHLSPQALPVIKVTPPSPPPSSASQPSSSPSQTLVPPIGTINPSSHGNAGVSTGVIVAIGAVLGLLMLISMIGLLVWCKMKRKRKVYGLSGGYAMPSPYGSSQDSEAVYTKPNSSAPLIGTYSGNNLASSPRNPSELGYSRPWFSYDEMFVATNGFSAQNLLGEGGFGPVYKGSLPDGKEIAVKQLKIGGSQGVREFEAEVETISRIHHRHLVSLVGYCIAEDRRLLIYEYVPNDTLYSHLHGEGRPVMDWATRVKVAAGAARGIAYLHEDCHPRIIHRDIKSSNILLDENFEAQVSDFGLAKLAIDAATHITTRVMGTFGYMAPEYASSGKLSEKSDVYSFGVVLLELITGRKPVDTSQSLGDESVVEWARPLLSDAFDTNQCDALVDPKLEKNYVEDEMFRMIEAAAACVRHSAVKRPQMGQVVRALDGVATSDLTNGMRPGQSEVYNSAEKSSEIKLFRRMAFDCQNYSTEYFTQSSMTGVKSDML